MSFKMQFEAETMSGLMRHVMEAAAEFGLLGDDKITVRDSPPARVIEAAPEPEPEPKKAAAKKPAPKKASNGAKVAPKADDKEEALRLCSQLYAGGKAQKDAVREIARHFEVAKLVDIPDDKGVEFLALANKLAEQFAE